MRRKKVLIVDDCSFFLSALKDLLGGKYLIDTARSGEEAIGRIEDAVSAPASGQYDLVITDLKMPGISGYDVASFVKGRNRSQKFTPVIMLTEMDISKEDARKNGCAAYIPKSNIQKVVSMANILTAK